MQPGPVVISAVLTTLLRATIDEGSPVVLRTRRPEQARELEHWLSQAHGSPRTVIRSVSATSEIEVRLPVRMRWPPPTGQAAALAMHPPSLHLSAMVTTSFPPAQR